MRLEARFRLFLHRIRARGLWPSVNTKAFHLRADLRVTSARKLWNWVLIKVQRWMRTPRLLGMPYRYVIDPVNYCVLSCPLCPTGRKTLGRAPGKLPVDAYRRLVDTIAPYAYYIDLFNWGEPFLHPDIFEMIQYASSRKIVVRISSNLNAFRARDAERLVRSGLTDLSVSVDGAEQETYEAYRVGGNLERVTDSVRSIVQAKRQLGSATPFINVRMLVTRKNEDAVQDVRALAGELGADVFSFAPIFVTSHGIEDADEWLPANTALSCYQTTEGRYEVVNIWDCADLWEQMTINWDGSVLPCCWLHEPEHDFGNVFVTSLRDVWNNSHYVNSRRVFSRRGPMDSPRTVCAMCRGRPEFRY